MKNKLRIKANIKHAKLIKEVKNKSYIVKEGTLSVQDYLKCNRFYFGINIG